MKRRLHLPKASRAFIFSLETHIFPHGVLITTNSKYRTFIYSSWFYRHNPLSVTEAINRAWADLRLEPLSGKTINEHLMTVMGPRRRSSVIDSKDIQSLVERLGESKYLKPAVQLLKEDWRNLFLEEVKRQKSIDETEVPVLGIYGSAHLLMIYEARHFGGLYDGWNADKALSVLEDNAISGTTKIDCDGFVRSMERAVRALTGWRIVGLQVVWEGINAS